MFNGTVVQLLARLKRTASMSEGRRIVVQGAVKVNNETITDLARTFDFKDSDTITVGKNSFTVGDFIDD